MKMPDLNPMDVLTLKILNLPGYVTSGISTAYLVKDNKDDTYIVSLSNPISEAQIIIKKWDILFIHSVIDGTLKYTYNVERAL